VGASSAPVRPPSNWKRERLAPAEHIIESVKPMLGELKALEVLWWQGRPIDEYESDDEAGWLMSFKAIALAPAGSPQEVVDRLVGEQVRLLETHAAAQPATPPRVKGQAVAVGLMEAMTKRTYLQARAQPGESGLHVLLVMCTTAIEHDACREAMQTVQLVAR
jgi:hypothetical protein